MALIPKPSVNIRWAENGNQLEPATEVQELGFVVEKPPYEVVNWLHNKHDTAVAYLYQEGFADWDIETEYSNTSYIKYDGVIYKAKLQNIGKQPDINPDNWDIAFSNYQAYLYQEGFADWDIETEYSNTSYIKYDGVIYKAKLQNIGKQPDINPDNWDIAFSNYQDYLDLYQDLQDTKNVSGHADNLVYKDSPVMTNKAVGTSFSANSGIGTNDGYQFNNHSRDGLFHNGTNPVVLNDGTTVASFRGNTSSPSDKDVVTFDMLKKYINPVGSLYFTTNNTNPNVELGFGTWERYAEGRAIVGYSSDATSATPDWVKQVGRTHGSYEHTLTEAELPRHTHTDNQYTKLLRSTGQNTAQTLGPTAGEPDLSDQGIKDIQPVGENKPHNNVQPSIVVFIWRRVS